MRISVHPNDPGYANYDFTMKYVVTLNGVHVPRCVTFDTDAGTVEVIASTLDGGILIDEQANDIVRRVLHGIVEYSTGVNGYAVNDLATLVRAERDKYDQVWLHDEYRVSSPGLRNLSKIVDALKLQPMDNVVDFGSGGGVTAVALHQMGFKRVIGVDISKNANAHNSALTIISPIHEVPVIQNVRAAYCVDVMEHIPEQLVSATLQRIALISPLVYFRIAMFEDHYGEQLEVGPLHLTVRTAQWWQDTLEEVFEHVEVLPDDEGQVFVALCNG